MFWSDIIVVLYARTFIVDRKRDGECEKKNIWRGDIKRKNNSL